MLNLHRVWGARWELLIGHLGDGILNLEIECGSHHTTDNFKSTPGWNKVHWERRYSNQGTSRWVWAVETQTQQISEWRRSSWVKRFFEAELTWCEFQGPGIPVRWKPQEAWGSPSKGFPKAWDRKNCSLQGQVLATEFYLCHPPAQCS